MTESLCEYIGARDDVLVSYVYEDLAPPGRAAFERHLLACVACRGEIEAFRSVRAQLGHWAPPEPVRAHAVAAATAAARPSSRWWQQVPAWAQVAAALLCVGVAAGFANLDIRYDRDGLTVRTGWLKRPAAPAAAAASPSAALWRADLAALEQQIRTEIRATNVSAPPARPVPSTAAPASASAESDIVRRVQSLVEESERKQRRELALRVAEVARDVDAQRRADLMKIDRSLGQIQDNTGVEVMRQRELLNYLVRVSQKP